MKIGNKVVCIDDSPCIHCGEICQLVKDQIYIIDSLVIQDGELYIGLVGLNEETLCHARQYESDRFRLLDQLKEWSRQAQSNEQMPP